MKPFEKRLLQMGKRLEIVIFFRGKTVDNNHLHSNNSHG